MEIFSAMAEHACNEIHLCHDPVSGLRAIVAIHSTRRGPALGGARYIPYASEADAFRDALRLSRAMTYKAALADLPLGGGKSVLIRPPQIDEDTRRAQLRAFGRFVDALGGRYITSEDSGTTASDLELVAEGTRYVSGAQGKEGDPSPLTAFGVRRGIEAAVKFALSRDSLEGLRVSIQGVGNVGAHLARDLAAHGCQLFLSDINQDKATQLAAELGAKAIPAAEIIDAPVDVFAPCALGGVLSEESVPRLRCRIVAGAANNQLAHSGIADLLLRRNILYAPDYAINAGGLIHAAQKWAGYDEEEVRRRCAAIYDTMMELFTRAAKEEKSPAQMADIKAEEALR